MSFIPTRRAGAAAASRRRPDGPKATADDDHPRLAAHASIHVTICKQNSVYLIFVPMSEAQKFVFPFSLSSCRRVGREMEVDGGRRFVLATFAPGTSEGEGGAFEDIGEFSFAVVRLPEGENETQTVQIDEETPLSAAVDSVWACQKRAFLLIHFSR